MKSTTENILKKAAKDFELKTSSDSWNALASALHSIEQRGRMFQWGAFASVFVLLMFVGKYLNPNETASKEIRVNRQLANAEIVAEVRPVFFAENKSVTQPSIVLSEKAFPLPAMEPMPRPLQIVMLPLSAPKMEAGFLKNKPTPTCDKPREGCPRKNLTLEMFGSMGISHRTIFVGSNVQTYSNTSQFSMLKQRPATFVSVGAMVSKQVSKNWNITTGLLLSKYGYTIYTSDIHKAGSNTKLGQYASYRLEVPLLADYKFNIGKAKLELRQGVVPALTLAQTSPLADNYTYYSDNIQIPKLQVAALFNPRLKMCFGKTELLVGPEIRCSLTNSYPNKYLLKEHLWSASLSVVMRVKI